jgi:hypothetical protein
MAKKKTVDEVAKLSEEMVRVLESRRDLGGAAYPPTLRRLAEFCGGTLTDESIIKAAGKAAFTKVAVATEKVDKKPSIDSPVYFKEDVPKPEALLAGRMLVVLEAQRRLGDGAYPPTLGRLAELCDLNASNVLVPKAVSHVTMVAKAIVAAKNGAKPALDAPVVLLDDIAGGVGAILPVLLSFALRPLPSKGKTKPVETHAFKVSDLVKRFVSTIQESFGEALEARIEREDLPGVAWVVIKGEPHLFLVENLRPASTTRPLPDSGHRPATSAALNGHAFAPTHPARDFAEAFRAAFEQLDRRNGSTNFVKLADLRRALSEFGREAFDAELRKLRLSGLFSLDSHEGLYGSLTPEEREAGVREAGSLLIYASRR